MSLWVQSERRDSSAAGPRASDPLALSGEPILSAVEAFRGKFIDADESTEVDGPTLAAATERLARLLAGRGLASGDRVLLAVGNGPRFVAALAASIRAGASPLLVHAKSPAAELVRTAQRYGAAHVLSDDPAADRWHAADIEFTNLALDDWAHFHWGRFRTGGAITGDAFPALPGVPLHPTSGTTGQSKLAARPGASAVAEAAHYAETMGVDEHDVILALTPMSHAYAFGMGVMLPLIAHATVVSLRQFAAAKAIAAIGERGVTVLPAVPAMLDVLLFGAGARALSWPRIVLSAGAPLSRRTVARFLSATGRAVCPLYGTTETGGITVATTGVGAEDAGCVGPAMRGVAARIGPAEGELPPAGAGRVEIRSSSMMLGYLAPGGVDASPLADGWFPTGDLGRIDGDGRIHLLGRETDVINVAGLKVVPSEIESVIGQLPEVVECKVYAGQHRSGAQFVKAAIVAEPPVDSARIRAHCEQQLVYYKRPERIYCLDALPRSAAGKIVLDQLP